MKLEKVTTSPAVFRRRYDDACAAAHALDLVGDRWALLVVRELMLGPKRFSDIRGSLPGLSANVLTQRLEELEAVGILTKRKLPPPASTQVYELTPWGYEAEPIFQALGRWAVRSPLHDPMLPISVTSLMLSLRAMIAPARAEGMRARIGFIFGEETFIAELDGGNLAIERGEPKGADVVFAGPVSAVGAVIYGGQKISDMIESGALAVTGDMALAERFVTLFPLPPKVGEDAQ